MSPLPGPHMNHPRDSLRLTPRTVWSQGPGRDGRRRRGVVVGVDTSDPGVEVHRGVHESVVHLPLRVPCSWVRVGEVQTETRHGPGGVLRLYFFTTNSPGRGGSDAPTPTPIWGPTGAEVGRWLSAESSPPTDSGVGGGSTPTGTTRRGRGCHGTRRRFYNCACRGRRNK